MNQPAWLARAWKDYGQREVTGAADNPRILQYYKDVGFEDVRHDEVAWCAAFVGSCLERSGLPSTRLLLARSYLQLGEALDAGRPGAIVVLTRGSDPALGHVGFWLGETADRIFLLGGNQGDAVSVEGFARDRLLGMRWPAPLAAAPAVPGETEAADPRFAAALAHVLEMEGGFTDDPHDPGGPTNLGVTLEVYADWRGERLEASSRARLLADLKAIDADSVARIYRQRYWQPSRAGDLPPPLGFMHFDAAVNHGVGGAARLLQEALDVEVDGEIGSETLGAAHSIPPAEAIAAYADIRRARYRSLPHFWRFGRGWLARVDRTEQRALAMPHARGTTDTTMKRMRQGEQTMSEQQEQTVSTPQGKWWGESMTIWGVIVTTLATVLPIVGPFIGLDISAEMVRQIGAQATHVLQAVAGLAGTLMTVFGRMRARGPLTLREMRVRL